MRGAIQACEILAPPVGRHVDETLRRIRAFRYVRSAGGAEATPSARHPGDPVLKVGPGLVGKVWIVWKP